MARYHHHIITNNNLNVTENWKSIVTFSCQVILLYIYIYCKCKVLSFLSRGRDKKASYLFIGNSHPISFIFVISVLFNAFFLVLCNYRGYCTFSISHIQRWFLECEVVCLMPNPKLEDHSWSAVHNSLFNIFSASLHL